MLGINQDPSLVEKQEFFVMYVSRCLALLLFFFSGYTTSSLLAIQDCAYGITKVQQRVLDR